MLPDELFLLFFHIFIIPLVIGIACTVFAVSRALAVVQGRVPPTLGATVLVFAALLSFFCFFVFGFAAAEFGRVVVFGSWPISLPTSVFLAFDMGFAVLLATGAAVSTGTVYFALKLGRKFWFSTLLLGALLATVAPPFAQTRVTNWKAEKQARALGIEIVQMKSLFYSLKWRRGYFLHHHGIAYDTENRPYYWSYNEWAWIPKPIPASAFQRPTAEVN